MHTFLDQRRKRRHFPLLSSGNNLPRSQRFSFLFNRKEIAFPLLYIKFDNESERISVYLAKCKSESHGKTLVIKKKKESACYYCNSPILVGNGEKTSTPLNPPKISPNFELTLAPRKSICSGVLVVKIWVRLICLRRASFQPSQTRRSWWPVLYSLSPPSVPHSHPKP